MKHKSSILLLKEFKQLLETKEKIFEVNNNNFYARNHKDELPILKQKIKGLDFAIKILEADI